MIGLLRQRVTEVSLEFYNKLIFFLNVDKIMFFYYMRTSTNKISTRSDFQISYFLNQQTFSDLEKSEIVFLESQNDINVTDPLLLYYLNYYLIQNLI